MDEQCIAAGHDWLGSRPGLSAAERDALVKLGAGLLRRLPPERPLTVGLSGPPGSGKSTLAGVVAAMASAAGDCAAVLSLDDYYLSAAKRAALARERSGLLAQRGVPGTHDLDRLVSDLSALQGGRKRLQVPRFDKSSDETLAVGRSLDLPRAASLIVLEGWCVGVPPQESGDLDTAVNALEHQEDGEGQFRRYVNRETARYLAALGPRLDVLIYLQAPDWTQVVAWRWHQEQDLPRDRRRLRSLADTRRFLATFERLGRHMHNTCQSWADAVIPLDPAHRPIIQEAHETT